MVHIPLLVPISVIAMLRLQIRDNPSKFINKRYLPLTLVVWHFSIYIRSFSLYIIQAERADGSQSPSTISNLWGFVALAVIHTLAKHRKSCLGLLSFDKGNLTSCYFKAPSLFHTKTKYQVFRNDHKDCFKPYLFFSISSHEIMFLKR